MLVSELIAQLQQFPADMEVLCDDRMVDALLPIERVAAVDVVTDTDGYAVDVRMFMVLPNPDTKRSAVLLTVEDVESSLTVTFTAI